MNNRQQRTLRSIFEEPTRSDIEWAQIESLLHGLGAEITQGRGSRVRIALNGVRAVFHRPHPERVTDRGAVRAMRGFLRHAGVEPK